MATRDDRYSEYGYQNPYNEYEYYEAPPYEQPYEPEPEPTQEPAQEPEAVTTPYAPPEEQKPTTNYNEWGGYFPEGLDMEKVRNEWDSPKYQIARILSHFDPNAGITPEVVKALNTLGIGEFYGEGETLGVRNPSDPRFEDYLFDDDIIRNFTHGEGESAAWQGWGGDNNQSNGGPAPLPTYTPTLLTTSTLPTVPGTTPGTTPAPGTTPGQSTTPKTPPVTEYKLPEIPEVESLVPEGLNEELWGLLLSRAKQGTDIDPNDPVIKRQIDAYSARQERARRDFLADQAERGNPYGTGYQQGQERMTAERLGQDVGGMEAELIAREVAARRAEIQQALDTMGGMMTEQQRMALQKEISLMSAMLDQQRVTNQNQQFYAGLSQQDAHFWAQLAQSGKLAELDAELRRAGLSQQDRHFMAQLAQQSRFAEMDDLFRRAQLNQQQSQWLDRMGFDERQAQNEWDWLQRGGKL